MQADRVDPRPIAPKPPRPKVAQLVDQKRRTKDVINAATTHNLDLAERLEETMEARRQKQIAKELADYHDPSNRDWVRLEQWRQSVERVEEQRRAWARLGENPITGNYDPQARYDREVKEGC